MGKFTNLKQKKVTVVAGAIFAVMGLFLLGIGLVFLLRPKAGSLRVEANKPARVFVNGVALGQTPFSSDKFKGEIDIKLLEDGGQEYRGKVTVSSGVTTVVRRSFGVTPELSSGMTLSFEKSQGGETSLIVISNPDAAEITVDGVLRGFAPYRSANIAPGSHDIVAGAVGFLDTKVTVNAVKGYKLTFLVDLERDGSITASPSPSPAPFLPVSKTVLVEIKDTPTGFLRVRADPSVDGEEIGRVNPKDRLPLVEESADAKWYKVEWEEGKTGWISVEFATRIGFVQETTSPVPSPSI